MLQAQIKAKVGFMGGVYTSNLIQSVTHLVTNAVRSAKYEVGESLASLSNPISLLENK